MLKASDAFNSAFAAPDRELHARVTIGKTVYDSDDLTSINYDSGAMTGEQFSIGSTYMNSTKITFSHLVEGLKQLDEVLVEFGVLKPDGAVEYVKMGTFIVDDKIQMDRNNNTTTIECMDRMTMLGGAYVSKLTYPARIKDVAVEIANMAGVKANETSFARLSENKINQPTGYTYRDAIGLIAQFQMGFALFDRDGLLDIRTLQDNSFKIDPNQYFLKGLVKNETFFKLNGISCTVVTASKDENGNETSKTTVLQSGSSSGAQIKLANNVMTQDVLDRMYEALKFTNYYPFSLNWNGNPAVEAGDWLTVEDLQGNEFKVPNMSYTLTYNGGLTATSKADTSVSSPATYSYGGTISNIVNEIGGRESAEGNHIYEGTEDQEPTLSKEGDLWYKHVGPDTEERIYKDGKWEFLTSTKTANDAADAADKASKEAEEAKKQANKAVDGANDAVAKAGFATDTATQAKSDAAAAGQQAKDALTSAKNALTNSSSAMADSTQARKDSATAIKNAADSLTSAKDALNKVGSLTTSVTSQFTTVNNELNSKVNQTDYDKLKGTVTSQQTEINQNASGIKLKADKSYADTINNNVVKNTSSVGLLNDQIALTVSKAELNNTLSSYATQTWTQSQIKSTADSINLSVTKVQNNLDNLAIGGRNYLLDTGNAKPGVKGSGVGNQTHSDYLFSFGSIKNAPFTDGDPVTLSFSYITTGTGAFGIIRPQFNNTPWGELGGNEPMKDTGRITQTVRWQSRWTTTGTAKGIMIRMDNVATTRTVMVYNVQFESGNKATDYKAAPEDMATVEKLSELQITVNGIQGTVQNKADQSQVTQLAGQISLKADTTALDTLKGTVDKQGSAIDVNTKAIALKANQSTVDTLTGRVSTAEGKITVQADQIAQTVSKTELTTKLNGYATQTWTQGKLDLTADGLTSKISSVKTDLTNLAIGGRNYFSISNFAANKYASAGIDFYDLQLLPNTKYTVSANDVGAPDPGWANVFAGNKNFTPDSGGNGVNVNKPRTVTTDSTGILTIAARKYSLADGKDKIQVELGTVATTWQPAPEDMATAVQFTSLEQTLNGFRTTVNNAATQTQVTQLAGQITSVVTSATNPNLIMNGGYPTTTEHWVGSSDFHVTTHDFYRRGTLFVLNNNSSNEQTIETERVKVVAGAKYTISMIVFGGSNVASYDIWFLGRKNGSTAYFDTSVLVAGEKKPMPTAVEHPNWTFTMPDVDEGCIRIDHNGTTNAPNRSELYFTEVKLEKGAIATPYIQSAESSEITQMKSDINLRVKAGDVVNQINISPESILIDGKKVHITGQTSIDNAVIKDAMIADIKADKITAGTLNAANVNVINLNANNITTGTIKGDNLSMNLNTGEVVFQHGRIHSTSNNVDVNIDQGYLSTASNDTRVMLKEGQLQLVQPTIFDNSKDPYLEISNSVGGASFNGANIIARDYLVLANRANAGGYFNNPLGQETFAGLAVGKSDYGGWHETRLGGAERGVIITGGKAFTTLWSTLDQSPTIRVGSMDPSRSDRISIEGSYVHIPSAYWMTASGSANLIVAQDGALVRSTSASKYKKDIIRTNVPDYGDKLLNLPTATWVDIAETKRFRDDPTNQPEPTRNFGMIAEDLADAGLEMLVVRGTDGELEGINYDRIGPALIPVIAKLKNEVETLKQQLEGKTA